MRWSLVAASTINFLAVFASSATTGALLKGAFLHAKKGPFCYREEVGAVHGYKLLASACDDNIGLELL